MAYTLLLFSLSLSLVQFSESSPIGDRDFAKNFLLKYKYITHGRSSAGDLTEGIKKFQEFFGLRVSGSLDKQTRELMEKPRCGNSDLVRVSLSGQLKRYVTASRWPKTHLTYQFLNHGQDIYWQTVEEIIAKALTFWSDVSSLTFSKVSYGSTSDIKFKFGRYHHGDSYPFDGPSGTLAHAFFPSDGRVHFDEDETYTHETSEGTNLLWVTVHELGHALGLHHTNIYGAVMYPYYQGYKPDMELHYDDIQGIQSLYPPTEPITPKPTTAPTTQTTTRKPEPTQEECKDLIDYCDDLHEADYCRKYPDNMRYYCRKTCGYCS